MTSRIVVVFGRPGAGKSTVSDKAVELNVEKSRNIACLDLDACVPQWMKDNFAKGIYPNLEQRKEFAVSACDYVDEKLRMMDQSSRVIISFSFVNTDLRDVFRARFPGAKWILINTDEAEAQDRIQKREGHFYKGAPPSKSSLESLAAAEENETLKADNSEWNFAPVEFDHVVLDGLRSIEENAEVILKVMN